MDTVDHSNYKYEVKQINDIIDMETKNRKNHYTQEHFQVTDEKSTEFQIETATRRHQ